MSFNRLLRQYPTHSKKSLSIDCFISTSRSPRNFFQSIATSVSLALMGVSFNRLLRQYQSRTLRNFFQSIVSSVPLALQGISFNRLFHQYLSLSKEFLSIDCYVSISLALWGISFNRWLSNGYVSIFQTLRILSSSIVTLVFRTSSYRPFLQLWKCSLNS